MVIKIKYNNNRYDLVKSEMLDKFLADGKVREFYRYSENRWVTVGLILCAVRKAPSAETRGGPLNSRGRSRDTKTVCQQLLAGMEIIHCSSVVFFISSCSLS